MSSKNIAIRVKSLSKCFELYDTPGNRLKQFVMPRIRRAVGQPQKQYYREYWALKDVSFEIEKGETVGVIGRNGAGKSTLLQILCGTLTPTNGSVEISGRVAALLELGAGFNAEFTGRENVYMNAGVLGLSKDEIDERLDDIIAFADIGEFLDRPVKTYSSGMYVRLAFSVVVHVDADILIVDEALSVGDMYFQAKCMTHMRKLMKSGVTVLFVSHDTNAVKAICNKAVFLERGQVFAYGQTDEVVEAYYGVAVKSRQQTSLQTKLKDPQKKTKFNEAELAEQLAFSERAGYQRLQNGMAEFLNVELLDEFGEKVESMDFGRKMTIRMTFKSNLDLPCIGLGYHIKDRNGFDIIYSDTGIEDCHITNLEADEVVVMDWEFHVNLRADEYTLAIGLSIPQDLSAGKVEVCDWIPVAANLRVCRREGDLPIYAAVYWHNVVSHHRFKK